MTRGGPTRWWVFVVLVGATVLASCTPPEPSKTVIDGETWREAQRELESLRASYTPKAETQRVSVRFTAASKDLHVSGRGAVARRPPDDLRMILVGPGGMTAFDLLVRGNTWRMKTPTREHPLRGEGEGDRGLPVSFLRWWLLRPLSGRLLSVADTPTGRTYVLREGNATIRVRRRGDGLVMDRKSPSGTERMSVSGLGCSTAVYQHVEARIRAEVECEAEVGGVDSDMFR